MINEKQTVDLFNNYVPEIYRILSLNVIKNNPYLKFACQCIDSQEFIQGYLIEDENKFKDFIQALLFAFFYKEHKDTKYKVWMGLDYDKRISEIIGYLHVFSSKDFKKPGKTLEKHFLNHDFLIITHMTQTSPRENLIEKINDLIKKRRYNNKKTFLCSSKKEKFSIELNVI